MKLQTSIQSISSFISRLFRADFWFDDRSETEHMKQLIDVRRHRRRAGPSATAHTCCMYCHVVKKFLDEALIYAPPP